MSTFVIADDSRSQRLWITQTLLSHGHTVVGDAGDGQTAVDLCRRFKPDFITLDINMPVLPGSEAAKVLIGEELCGHVIVLTLNTQSSIVDPLRALGCTIWTKPFTSKERFIQLLGPLLK